MEVDRAPRARAPPTNLPTRDLTSTYVAHLPWRASSRPSEDLHAGHLRFTSYVASNLPYARGHDTMAATSFAAQPSRLALAFFFSRRPA